MKEEESALMARSAVTAQRQVTGVSHFEVQAQQPSIPEVAISSAAEGLV